MAGHLRIGRGHRVDFQGGRGEWARFVPVDLAGGFTALKSLGHANAGNTIFLALAATSVASQSTSLTSASTIGDRSAFEVLLQEEQLQRADPPPMFPLSFAHKEALMSTGYLLLPGLVPTPQVEAALRAINAHLGLGAAAWSEEEGRPALAGGIKSARPIMYLLYATAAFGVVEQLLGRPRRPHAAQIALRFPTRDFVAEQTEDQWHIDGMKKPHMSPFQLLLGVALSATPADDCGNLGVWPRSHTRLHEEVRRRALEPPRTAENVAADPWGGARPALDGSAVQLQLQPGDVVLVHQKVAHRVCKNASPHVRYQVYFRLSHVLHDAEAPLGGLWDHFEGLAGLEGLEEGFADEPTHADAPLDKGEL